MSIQLNSKHFINLLVSIFLVIVSFISNKEFLLENYLNNVHFQIISYHYFYPYILDYFINFLYKYTNSFYFILLTSYLPFLLVFNLLITIYNRYTTYLWSLSLSLISISFILDYSFIVFVSDLIKFNFFNISSVKTVLLSPIPSISILISLLTIYYIINIKYISFFKSISVTLIILIQTYIHALDASFVLIIWFTFLAARLYYKNLSIYEKLIIFFPNILIASLFIIYLFLSTKIEHNNMIVHSNINYFSYFLKYISVPTALAFLILKIYKVDIREINFHFLPYFSAMILEIIYFLFTFSGLFPIDLTYIERGMPQFFLHAMYYVPILYYLKRIYLQSTFNSNYVTIFLSNNLKFIFFKYHIIYLPFFIFLLLVYNTL